MLKTLKLARFRGFRELEMELRPVSVVLGPNSSGKTTVLHAVRMATQALATCLDEPRLHLDEDGWITAAWERVVADPARLYPMGEWDELFTNKEIGEGIWVQMELGFEPDDVIQELHVAFWYARNAQIKMTVRLQSSIAREQAEELPKKSKFRASRLAEIIAPAAPLAIFVPPFYGAPKNEEYRGWQVVQSHLGGGDQGRIVRNLISRLNSNDLLQLEKFLAKANLGRIVARTAAQDADSERYLSVTFQDTNGALELSSAGAGLVNLLALYATMVEFSRPTSAGQRRPLLYLLDEPEAHLHPRLQGDMGVAFAELATDFKAQLVVATHSVEMINRLSLRKDAILIAVDRSTSTAVELGEQDALLRELGSWCDLTPFAAINFLAKKQIIFHEGPSDELLLKRCADVYFRNRIDELERFRRWIFVPLNGVGNAHSPAVLSALLNADLFPSLNANEPIRVLCLLDRDAEREPGWKSLSLPKSGHFQAQSFVWSRYGIESIFLSPPCLAAWIALRLPKGGIDEAKIRAWVEEGIEQANRSNDLNIAATTRRMRFLMRAEKDNDGSRWQRVGPEAAEMAYNDVMKSPDVWQDGKDRAQHVLGHVHQAMPTNALRNAIPTSITRLIQAGSMEPLGDSTLLVPQEIRELLDQMASKTSKSTSS